MSLYQYYPPPGYGDTFFQYVFDAQNASPALVNGNTYFQQGIPVLDGSFLVRHWSGLPTIATQLQIYDWLRRQFAASPMNLGAGTGQYGQMVVLPEVEYPDSGNIRFDLTNVAQDSAGVDTGTTIYRSQLIFSGVRRRAGAVSDPMPSSYKYYEKPFSYPFTLAIDRYATSNGVFNAPQQMKIPVDDYDFELRRVELALTTEGQASPFKIQMYNNDWRQLSNIPVLSNLFCHTDSRTNSGELAFWPSPPVVYRVNSVIRFDIYSLLVSPTVLPATFHLNFVGVRRINC